MPTRTRTLSIPLRFAQAECRIPAGPLKIRSCSTPQQVARFARDVLRIKGVSVTVLNGPQNATEELLTEMLAELRRIRLALTREPPTEGPSPWDALSP